jgi:DNA-binding HxlR family transcriptional regulator
VRRTPLGDMRCSIARATDVLGDPWTMLIVRDLLVGVTRFDDLVRRLGIPRATLAARLQALAERGIVERRRYQERPPRDEYVLTDRGRALQPVIVTLMQWGDAWLRDDEPPTHLEEATTGRRLEPVLVDRSSGVPLAELPVRAVGEITRGLRRDAD